MTKKPVIAVIGAGAAGFFGAIACAEANPDAKITIYEKGNHLLSKVRISGGGRCNVTHACFQTKPLSKNYPRGEKQLYKAFERFQASDTVQWFETRGVKLKQEADGRMFPVTNDSETIIKCLLQEARKNHIDVITQAHLKQLVPLVNGGFELHFQQQGKLYADKVLIAIGGHPKPESYQFLADIGHAVVPPVPSLFTFNLPDKELTALQGISVPRAIVKVVSSKLAAQGPLLITHWGISGPAVLRLSAWGARWLQEKDYQVQVLINWVGADSEEEVSQLIKETTELHGKKQLSNQALYHLPQRLWDFLVTKSDIDLHLRWIDLSKKQQNKLIQNLFAFLADVKGKSTYKDEFVTCGGVDLASIDFHTMQSRTVPSLFFAGEVIDIDGITGGFNFQNAWTTGYIAGMAMAQSL